MLKPKFMKQIDKRWASNSYSAQGERTTIAKSGCGPTTCANVVGALVNSKCTPESACDWFVKHGYKAKYQGTYYSGIDAFLKKYNIPFVRTWYGDKNKSKHKKDVLSCLKKGGWAILILHGPCLWTRGGHFVLAYGVAGDYVYISDPASLSKNRAKNKYSLLDKCIVGAWLIEDPASLVNGKGSIKDNGQEFKMYISSAEGFAYMRKEPHGELKSVKGKIEHGTPIIVKGEKDGHVLVSKFYKGKGEWYNIKSPAYVSEKCVSKYKQEKKYYITNKKVNILDGYISSADKIGTIDEGVSIVSSKQRGAYAYVKKQKGVNVSGWVKIHDKDKKNIYLDSLRRG